FSYAYETARHEISPLSLHDALPICPWGEAECGDEPGVHVGGGPGREHRDEDEADAEVPPAHGGNSEAAGFGGVLEGRRDAGAGAVDSGGPVEGAEVGGGGVVRAALGEVADAAVVVVADLGAVGA